MTQQQMADHYVWDSPNCTLNGEPAYIVGRLLPYAVLRTLDGNKSVQFAWETVHHIMTEQNGDFHS